MPYIGFLIASSIVGGISYLVLDKSEKPLHEAGNLVKYLTIGGALYAVYQVAKKRG